MNRIDESTGREWYLLIYLIMFVHDITCMMPISSSKWIFQARQSIELHCKTTSHDTLTTTCTDKHIGKMNFVKDMDEYAALS